MSRFILLGTESTPPALDEALLRAVILENARFACDDTMGRKRGDPVFEEVVEGRQKWDGYSSCADAIHWCLRRAGYRNEAILNRDDDDGRVPWRPSVNISRLVYGTGRAFHWARPGEIARLVPGDMALLGDHPLEHVCIVAGIGPDTMVSYDYGQFFDGAHGGRRVTRRSHTGTDGRRYFFATTLPGRPLIGWLNLFELLEGPFLRNELEPAEVPDHFEGGTPARPPSDTERRALVTTPDIENALVTLGYEPGIVDGLWTRKTQSAVKAFQKDNDLIADGVVGRKTRAKMREMLARHRKRDERPH